MKYEIAATAVHPWCFSRLDIEAKMKLKLKSAHNSRWNLYFFCPCLFTFSNSSELFSSCLNADREEMRGENFSFSVEEGGNLPRAQLPIVTGRNVFHQLDCSIQNCTVHTSPVKKKCEEHFPIDRKRCFDCRSTCVYLHIVSLTSSRPVFHFYTHKSLHHTFPRHQSRLEENKNKKKNLEFWWVGGIISQFPLIIMAPSGR
jgi:hypothetical protein